MPFVLSPEYTQFKFTSEQQATDLDWVLPARYTPIHRLGEGAFGQVMKCRDTKLNKDVAIKRIMNTFAQWEDGLGEIREIKAMMHCKHSRIISLDGLLPPVSKSNNNIDLDPDFDDIYLVMPMKPNNIEKINRTVKLQPDHITWILYQLLDGVAYLHGCEIVHRDLKPENLLCDEKVQITIIDLGLARELGNDISTAPSEYVMTRWYRAPEIMALESYDYKVDVWSIGCIVTELMTQQAIFPCNTEIQMLEQIAATVPDPNDYLGRKNVELPDEKVISMMPYFNRNNVDIKTYPTGFLDLLQGMLTPDPAKRLTAAQALVHPALAKWAQYKTKAKPTTFKFHRPHAPEDPADQMDLLRTMVWGCIQEYNPGLPARQSLLD